MATLSCKHHVAMGMITILIVIQLAILYVYQQHDSLPQSQSGLGAQQQQQHQQQQSIPQQSELQEEPVQRVAYGKPLDNGKESLDAKKSPPIPHPFPAKQLPPTSNDQKELIDEDDVTRNIFSKSDASKLRAAQKSRYFTASGFEYCAILNNATFDSLAYIHSLKGTLADLNPPMEIVTSLIDTQAQSVFNLINKGNPFLEQEPLKRFSCYAAAEGSNPVANFSETRFLKHVHPETYMLPVLPAYKPSTKSPLPGPRRKYKMAFLIMAHGGAEVLENLKAVVDELDDGQSLVLIHVDKLSEPLYEVVEKWIAGRRSPGPKMKSTLFVKQQGSGLPEEKMGGNVQDKDYGSGGTGGKKEYVPGGQGQRKESNTDSKKGGKKPVSQQQLQQQEQQRAGAAGKRKNSALDAKLLVKEQKAKVMLKHQDESSKDREQNDSTVDKKPETKPFSDSSDSSNGDGDAAATPLKNSDYEAHLQRRRHQNPQTLPSKNPPPLQKETLFPTYTNNVHLTSHRYAGMWGHVSLVWMQLSGYWELLDMADFEYVINLSAFDFPLRRPEEMYRFLKKQGRKGGEVFIEYWSANSESTERLTRPHLPRADRPSIEYSLHHPQELGLMYPPFRSWSIVKHHQWMILTQDFVKHLREWEEMMDMLAFMEYAWIPDESFLGIAALNSPVYKDLIIRRSYRYLQFTGTEHPTMLGMEHVDQIGEEDVGQDPANLFVRKVDIRTEGGRNLTSWIREHHLDRHSRRIGEGRL
ncbi:hypothetical protein HDV05_008375 [Chytridiales sp. JEL 0842]|nr:hypothetical protein HDV05_008375 [Chytridiales sp. JEL 0842]